jgi:hypothetical protein
MMLIENHGQAIRSTTYWDSDQAKAGLLYLSWNVGAARLLIPDSAKPLLREMTGARLVIVSRGPWLEHGRRDALELLWEDGSDAPFCVHLVAEQTDRLIPEEQQGGGFAVTAWTRGGIKARWPGKYRVVPQIPDASPWSDQ